MTINDSATSSPDATFAWHPDYAGHSHESVYRELVDSIRRDQSAYHLTLENAEKEEFGAFQTVRDLEKRWSEYDFGWFDTDPEQLAQRILDFELEREKRQELMSWNEWRASTPAPTSAPRRAAVGEKTDWRENLSEEQRRKIASFMAIAIMVLGVLVCVGLFFLIR